jgi:phage shock protein A
LASSYFIEREEADLMALINRMSRLFTADVHAVLDRIEEPDVLLKHAVREMEEELARSEHHVRSLEDEHGALGERQKKTRIVLADLDEQLDVCFVNGNEDLARKVIKRRLETERLERHVRERRAALDQELAARRAALDEQREQLDVMRQKAELLTATAAGEGWPTTEFAVGEAEVEVALLRERQKRQRS